MHITTTQAGELLGVTKNTVINLVKQGRLLNQSAKAEEGKRQTYRLSDKEVKAYVKEHGKGHRNSGNGSGDISKLGAFLSQQGQPSLGIMGSLRAIEAKLDRLLAMWEN